MENDIGGPVFSVEERGGGLDWLVLLSRGFWGPSPELCLELSDVGFGAKLDRLKGLLGAAGDRAIDEMAGYLAGVSGPEELCDTLEAAYVRLFVTAPGGAIAPPYHSCYESEDGLLMGRPAAMMKERLAAAGLWLEGRASEPPDHLAVELEYLYLLLESGFGNSVQALIDGAREFAKQEMAPWVRVWAGRLANETEERFYPAAARLVEGILQKISNFTTETQRAQR